MAYVPADIASTETIPNASVALDVTKDMEANGRSNPSSSWFKQPVTRMRSASFCAVKRQV